MSWCPHSLVTSEAIQEPWNGRVKLISFQQITFFDEIQQITLNGFSPAEVANRCVLASLLGGRLLTMHLHFPMSKMHSLVYPLDERLACWLNYNFTSELLLHSGWQVTEENTTFLIMSKLQLCSWHWHWPLLAMQDFNNHPSSIHLTSKTVELS